jgi:hypothetical protein
MIYKEKVESNFAIIPNETAQDKNLSMAAKGLMLYFLSLPDNWVILITEIKKHFPDGLRAIRTAMKELEKTGYVYKEDAASSRNVKFHAASFPHTQKQWQLLLSALGAKRK